MDDASFRILLDFLGLSWRGYRRVKKGVKRRVDRYMQEAGFQTLDSLLSAMKMEPGRRAHVENLMTVSVSRFFRDRDLWKGIETSVLPAILFQQKKKIRIWSAGCARGEEAYSFRILWEELSKKQGQVPELELWATDRNPEILDRAKTGTFGLSSLKEVPEEWRVRYFQPAMEGQWEICETLKEVIHWQVNNLETDSPPADEFQLIFSRNSILTYYRAEKANPALRKVLKSLSSGGFLVIGVHEKLPKEFHELALTAHANVFFKAD